MLDFIKPFCSSDKDLSTCQKVIETQEYKILTSQLTEFVNTFTFDASEFKYLKQEENFHDRNIMVFATIVFLGETFTGGRLFRDAIYSYLRKSINEIIRKYDLQTFEVDSYNSTLVLESSNTEIGKFLKNLRSLCDNRLYKLVVEVKSTNEYKELHDKILFEEALPQLRTLVNNYSFRDNLDVLKELFDTVICEVIMEG